MVQHSSGACWSSPGAPNRFVVRRAAGSDDDLEEVAQTSECGKKVTLKTYATDDQSDDCKDWEENKGPSARRADWGVGSSYS